ncbi:unnamed protein product [Effrenium voratum]|uniref:Cytochrome b5 heme-binding domain-containing protein n=1 Tax=Effrenium voratum TaxID=2562239 RepID=A0AA36IY46_9DINO|nr:unnamed protein product [Effrenium voratum]
MADAKPRRKITTAELQKHSSESNAWMACHGLVLDLSKEFLEEHPGGPDVVTALAGKDGTQDFEDISHSDSARDWASKLIIGYMEGAGDEEELKTKTVPKHAEANRGGGGGGGLGAFIPALAALLLAGAVYYFLNAPRPHRPGNVPWKCLRWACP